MCVSCVQLLCSCASYYEHIGNRNMCIRNKIGMFRVLTTTGDARKTSGGSVRVPISRKEIRKHWFLPNHTWEVPEMTNFIKFHKIRDNKCSGK